MKIIKILIFTVCATLLPGACAKQHYPVRQFKKQLTGQWQLVSQGGGFGGLPETSTNNNIVVEFSPDGMYRNYTNGVVQDESGYTIKYAKSALSGEEKYVIVLKEDMPYLNFTVSETELMLSADHVDAMYFKYTKIKK